MESTINTGTLWFVIGIAGSLISILMIIIGFFIVRLITDIKNAKEDAGKNKGRIELVEQQQRNDIARIEQMVQLELKIMSERVGDMSDKVGDLADSIKTLVFGGRKIE